MLGLELTTDPRWVNLAEMRLEDILTDHAYCEQKAATSCISLIQSYPDKERLVRELMPIVTEEWGHFKSVVQMLDSKGLKLGFQRKDEYVNGLMRFQEKGGSREDRLVERLLVCALIEARSCERFKLLSEELESAELREFYRGFMISEAGHYRLFLDLAKLYGDEEKVKARWKEYLAYEKGLMRQLELRGDRMH